MVESALAPTLPPEDLRGDRLLSQMSRDPSGRPLIGGIALLRRIGRGGMGAVYYAVHPRLQVEVAVKILPFHLAEQDASIVARFMSEARVAASLASDHLVRVLDVNEEKGTHYLVMEYVAGESAGARLARQGKGGLPELEALDIVIAATRGLAAAHERGIVHRDIKPDNILIPKGSPRRAKLADLGLAKPADAPTSAGTMPHMAMGTPGYIAPEQAEDARSAGSAADVFSMGATLHTLLAGRPPFSGSSLVAILKNTLERPPEPLPETVSASTRAVIARCLAKDPKQRFPSAAHLLKALLSPATARSAPGRKLTPWPWLAVGVGVLAALVLGLAVPFGGSSSPPPPPAPAGSPRAAAYADYLRAADVARLNARWDAMLEACHKAEANASTDEERQAVRALALTAAQQRGWADARTAEARGALPEALELARRAAGVAEAPVELKEYVSALETKIQAADARTRRKRHFEEIASRARREKSADLWRQALETADDPKDRAEAERAIADLQAQARQEERERRYQAAMDAGWTALQSASYDAAEREFRAALAVKDNDAAALRALEKVAAERNRVTLKFRPRQGETLEFRKVTTSDVKGKLGSMHTAETNRVTITFALVADGRLLKRVNAVEEAAVETRTGRDRVKKTVSPLQGRKITVTRKDGKLVVEGADDLDGKIRREFTLDEDLTVWMPSGPKSVGESWDIVAPDIVEAIGSRLNLELRDVDLKCTLQEIRDVGGRRCAVIASTIEVKSDTVELRHEGKSTVWIERGYVLSNSAKGTLTLTSDGGKVEVTYTTEETARVVE